MSKSKTRNVFVCQECGAQRAKWEGQCRDCGAWGSFVEEVLVDAGAKAQRPWAIGQSTEPGASPPQTHRLDEDFVVEKMDRTKTGFIELDRVLGGGLVPGSFILLGGDPGVGKSTLLMQMAGGLARGQHKVLYISGEESVPQSALRAQRLGVRSALVEVASESSLDTILVLARNKKPNILIVDSIQTVFSSDLSAAPGTVSQVRECASRLMGLAKNEGITVLLIGHVTKDGQIAGPKVLEHMVDTVLSFEGDLSHQFRLLRALKNRFGATHELGVFQMANEGLREVTNPSELFLEERGDKLIGSAVFPSMEGTRPLLCEVQALTTYSPLAMPRRTAIGVDVNRLHLLVAVLSKHLHLDLAHSDVFTNVVGGLKIIEPAADLAVAAAILSSEGRQDVPAKCCFFGEIGLTGEVRAVSFVEQRLQEAVKLGFDTFILPASNEKHLRSERPSKSKYIFIRHLSELNHFFAQQARSSSSQPSRPPESQRVVDPGGSIR